VSEDARKLFGADANEPATLRHVEAMTGLKIQQLNHPETQQIKVADRAVTYSLVPLSGSAGGAVLVFKSLEIPDQSPFATYVRETVLMPLRSLYDSLDAAEKRGKTEPLLHDAASTIDQILTSLELASNVEEPHRSAATKSVSQIVHQIAEQFRSTAVKRRVTIQIDIPEINETFSSEVRMSACLQTLLENALHYVPDGGQIVVGARLMEHKEKPLLLFFVMDNGPTIPEEYRKSIFDPGFVWDPRDSVRTGGGLAKCRQFAIEHGGSIWVESKTGKACTFFLRVRPDGVF
jgi:signal transduction histidine kinase